MSRPLPRLLPLLLWIAGPAAAQPAALPEHEARDPLAAEVTAFDLAARERFWPYRTSLLAPLPAAGLAAGESGVLLRIEEGGRARIDFGRGGVHTVPATATDLVERANHVRLGRDGKLAPNLVAALGPRLVDPADPAAAPLDLPAASLGRPWLCVFAAADDPALPAIVAACRQLPETPARLTVWLPLGAASDQVVRQRAQELGWDAPWVRAFLAGSYARGLLPDEMAAPAVLLLSAEGRLLFASRWLDTTPVQLAEALSR